MKIKKLKLSNYRAFSTFECTFNNDLNVLVGLNGFGKTTILDAIACAFGQFVAGFETGKDIGISDSDIRLSKNIVKADDGLFLQEDSTLFNMERQFPVVISVESYQDEYNFPLNWSRTRKELKGRTSQVKELKEVAQALQDDVKKNTSVTLPLLGFYGTGRLWKQKRLTEGKNPANKKDSRLDGYQDCLDPESSYSAFASWLRRETIADFEHRMKIAEYSGLEDAVVKGKTLRQGLLAAVNQAINVVLQPSGWSNVRYSAQAKEVVASHKFQGDVPVSSLSDGVRNMIGMIADIAYRAVKLNPHFGNEAVLKTSGIVLIDEVDMHLHPQWQQFVLQNISEAFPKLQFFVTTHSPQVLTTVESSKILILPDLSAGKTVALPPIGETLGKESSYVLTQTLSVSSRPPLPQVKIYQEYVELINSGLQNSKAAHEKRAELESIIGTGHEDLQKADRLIKRRELLGK